MNKLKEIRKKNNISQEVLAEMLGVTRANISSLEKEKSYLTAKMIDKLVKIFNCSADYLLGYVNEEGNVEIWHEYDTLSDEEKRVLDYYSRLSEENQDYIRGKMVEFYKEQESKQIINTNDKKKQIS